MADSKVYSGQTSIIRRFRILDATGVPVTGLTAADIPSISTIHDNESVATVFDNVTPTIEGLDSATPGVYVAPTPTFMRFGEVDPVNHKGDYELQFENARFPIASSTEFRIMLASFTTPVTALPALALVDDISYIVEVDSRDPEAAAAHSEAAAAAAGITSVAVALVLGGGVVASSTSTTMTATTAIGATTDNIIGAEIDFFDGVAFGQARTIIGYVSGTKVYTVDRPFTTNPGAGSGFRVKYANLPNLDSNLAIARVTLADLITAYTGDTPQTGNVYPIANSGTFGNAAIKTLLDLVATYVDTEVAAIKAKTDNIPGDPADASDIAGAFGTVNATLSTIAAYIDTEVAAIKAKTDTLPADPADASDIAALFATVNTKLDAIDDFIDTEVAAIKAKTDLIPGSPAAVGSAMTLSSGERDATAAALLDLANALETGITLRKAMRAIAAMAAGKVSGMDTNAPVFRSIGDTKNVISATTTADGNRTAVTTDLT